MMRKQVAAAESGSCAERRLSHVQECFRSSPKHRRPTHRCNGLTGQGSPKCTQMCTRMLLLPTWFLFYDTTVTGREAL
jgi:hypothetical protein